MDQSTPSGPRRSSELHPTRLLRGAQGDRSEEAAILLLTAAQLICDLHSAIVVDLRDDRAWIDWEGALALGERLPPSKRSTIALASALAREAQVVISSNRAALTAALHHLLA